MLLVVNATDQWYSSVAWNTNWRPVQSAHRSSSLLLCHSPNKDWNVWAFHECACEMVFGQPSNYHTYCANKDRQESRCMLCCCSATSQAGWLDLKASAFNVWKWHIYSANSEYGAFDYARSVSLLLSPYEQLQYSYNPTKCRFPFSWNLLNL